MSESTNKTISNTTEITDLLNSVQKAKADQIIVSSFIEALYPKILEALKDFVESIKNCNSLAELSKLKKQESLYATAYYTTFPADRWYTIKNIISTLVAADIISVTNFSDSSFIWEIKLNDTKYFNPEIKSAIKKIKVCLITRSNQLEEIETVSSYLKTKITRFKNKIFTETNSNNLKKLNSISGEFELDYFYDTTKAFLDENNIKYTFEEKNYKGVSKFHIKWTYDLV